MMSPNPKAPDPPLFLRMDADGDGQIEISNARRTLEHLFLDAPPPDCPDAADADDDGRLDPTGAIFTILSRFAGGGSPPFPRGCCGLDPTADPFPECRYDPASCAIP